MRQQKTICVYCGSSVGFRKAYSDAARELGGAMAANGYRLVYGGAQIGLMGVLAGAVLSAGGEVTGVIPRYLAAREVAHTGLTELHLVETMHERKQLMANLADAFVALPGGYGTLDEFCEVLGWAQLGLHAKPVILLDTENYWEPLLTMFDRAVENGFVKPENRRQALRAACVADIFTILQQ